MIPSRLLSSLPLLHPLEFIHSFILLPHRKVQIPTITKRTSHDSSRLPVPLVTSSMGFVNCHLNPPQHLQRANRRHPIPLMRHQELHLMQTMEVGNVSSVVDLSSS